MRFELGGRTSVVLGIACSLVTGLPAFAANPERDAYFGETHVHTSWSLDAFAIGNILTTPGDAYKYFKGEPIKHPLGYDVKIDTPLDWAGVTDHSEYAGVVNLANEPGSAVSKLPEAQPLILKAKTKEEMERVALYAINTLVSGPPVKALMSPEIAGTVWKRNVALADAANQPGKFTAFCSYEWTSMPNNMNLHRNVFFKDCAKVPPMPFSALDSFHPVDLWNWMDGQRKAGNDLLAISHNANLSDGRMYPTDVDSEGRPIDAAYAASRVRNEPLIEIKQLKGTSETHPLLSPSDEFANFELMSVLLGSPPGRIPHIVGSYARQALKDGLSMQDSEGFNPYKFGFGAASDSHNTAVPYRQNNFFGGHSFTDGTIEARMSGTLVGGMFDARTEGTSGLTGVWAEENTRASLFEGMQRKETFAVTGPHIKLRFFGGWEYAAALLAGRDWVKSGYAKGVPMGGDLPPARGKAPTFIVWAVKDPTSGNLDRIQIVKGWTTNGQSFEKVFDVAWAGNRKPDKWTGAIPPIGSTVNIEKAVYTNTIGAVELKKVWTDPEFDPSLHAFYYARVLEIPTPRWTTIQAAKLGIVPPDVVAATLQERAWSSPIWYTPSAEARKAAKPGTTVADLKKQGAAALSDDQLKALIPEKSVWLQNNVTGERYMIIYGALGKGPDTKPLTPSEPGFITQRFPVNQGQFQVRYVGRNVALQSLTGDTVAASYLGTTRTYNIAGGKLFTELEGTPIETTVYKLGDKYFGARSNEFGYANYEIVPKLAEFGSPAVSMLGRLLREPLLHFVLLGGLLFAAYHGLHRDARQAEAPRRIELTADDLRQIRIAWLAQGRPALSPEELKQLVDERVREEVLYREALALGLDKDDAIVRRRMAQKMEFLFEDVAALREPTRDELHAWFEKHADRFARPARASFRHLYFSPDRRGPRARADADAGLAKLSGRPEDSPAVKALADPFMFQDYFADRSPDDVAKTFGPQFAQALFRVAPGAWAGPIESGYGWHLVWVEAITPTRVPDFEEVEPDVKTGWIEDQRAEIRARAFAAMRARYQVVLPKDPGDEALATLPSAAVPPL